MKLKILILIVATLCLSVRAEWELPFNLHWDYFFRIVNGYPSLIDGILQGNHQAPSPTFVKPYITSYDLIAPNDLLGCWSTLSDDSTCTAPLDQATCINGSLFSISFWKEQETNGRFLCNQNGEISACTPNDEIHFSENICHNVVISITLYTNETILQLADAKVPKQISQKMTDVRDKNTTSCYQIGQPIQFSQPNWEENEVINWQQPCSKIFSNVRFAMNTTQHCSVHFAQYSCGVISGQLSAFWSSAFGENGCNCGNCDLPFLRLTDTTEKSIKANVCRLPTKAILFVSRVHDRINGISIKQIVTEYPIENLSTNFTLEFSVKVSSYSETVRKARFWQYPSSLRFLSISFSEAFYAFTPIDHFTPLGIGISFIVALAVGFGLSKAIE